MTTLPLLVIIALIATVVSLTWGIVSMAHGGPYDMEHSNKLMGARILFQAIAVLLLLLALSA